MAKPTVGLTGGIASGKSTVAAMFRELRIPTVDADAIAREVVEPGTEGLRAIVEAFGEGVLAPDGTLDRKKLGDIVFRDGQARGRLNAITHPRIAARSAERMQELGRGEAPYLIYEAALLVENDIYRAFDALVVVAADEATQVARLRERDGIDEAAARARIVAQLPLERKIEVADFVVRNDGSVEDTREQVRRTHEALMARFGAGGTER